MVMNSCGSSRALAEPCCVDPRSENKAKINEREATPLPKNIVSSPSRSRA